MSGHSPALEIAPIERPNGKSRIPRCRSHCAACNRCFTGDAAFDAHITAAGHVSPLDVARLRDVGPGECRLQGNAPPLAGVPVWSATSEADALRLAGAWEAGRAVSSPVDDSALTEVA